MSLSPACGAVRFGPPPSGTLPRNVSEVFAESLPAADGFGGACASTADFTTALSGDGLDVDTDGSCTTGRFSAGTLVAGEPFVPPELTTRQPTKAEIRMTRTPIAGSATDLRF